MRNYKKLRAFELADELVVAIYHCTKSFPNDERFGLTSQMRRAAVSIPSNIVEGSSRNTLAEYLRFLDIAYGSACELEYQVNLAFRLGYMDEQSSVALEAKCGETARVLNGLIAGLRKRQTDSLEPGA